MLLSHRKLLPYSTHEGLKRATSKRDKYTRRNRQTRSRPEQDGCRRVSCAAQTVALLNFGPHVQGRLRPPAFQSSSLAQKHEKRPITRAADFGPARK